MKDIEIGNDENGAPVVTVSLRSSDACVWVVDINERTVIR